MSPGAALTLTGVLLAGGESRRMGRDKAALVVGGRPLWERQLALLRELPIENLWVSARLVPSWCPAGVDPVTDVAPSRGPLSGLVACLQRLQSTHLLVLAVDLPRMSSAHLGRLWVEARPGRGVLPLSGHGYEPLCAIYPREAAASVAGALNHHGSALRPVVAALVAHGLLTPYPLSPDDGCCYANMNTPDDCRQLGCEVGDPLPKAPGLKRAPELQTHPQRGKSKHPALNT